VDRPALAELLDLAAHPEGGWYRQTWRSAVEFTPDGYPGSRAAATAIYFALHPGEQSAPHLVRSDELWFWHSGGSLALTVGVRTVLLGPDLIAGERPQTLVPGGTWQSARPAGTEPVLVSCVVAPGFDFADFQLAE
jgi:predicted cupin superfamily sugar epimerase